MLEYQVVQRNGRYIGNALDIGLGTGIRPPQQNRSGGVAVIHHREHLQVLAGHQPGVAAADDRRGHSGLG